MSDQPKYVATPEFLAAEAFVASEYKAEEFDALEQNFPLLYYLIPTMTALAVRDEETYHIGVEHIAEIIASRWRLFEPRFRAALATADLKFYVAWVGVSLAFDDCLEPIEQRVRERLEEGGKERVVEFPIYNLKTGDPIKTKPILDFFPTITPFWFKQRAIMHAEKYMRSEVPPDPPDLRDYANHLVDASPASPLDALIATEGQQAAALRLRAIMRSTTEGQQEFLAVWQGKIAEGLDVQAAKKAAANETNRSLASVRQLLFRIRTDRGPA